MSSQVERMLGFGSSVRTGTNPDPGALQSGFVTRVDSDGSVWVTADGGDARTPLGPCRGALRPRLIQQGQGVYDLQWRPLSIGTPVLFATTGQGVWIVNHETRGN